MPKILYGNKWLQFRKIEDRDRGIKAYYYAHEIRCGGFIVALLPWRVENGIVKVLLRQEVVPCWQMQPSLSIITGGAEPGKTLMQTARQELLEEGGFDVENLRRFLPLGSCFGTKSVDTVYTLYGVNVHGLKQEPAQGDGTVLEDLGKCVWIEGRHVNLSVDPLTYILYHRLSIYIRRTKRGKLHDKRQGNKKGERVEDGGAGK